MIEMIEMEKKYPENGCRVIDAVISYADRLLNRFLAYCK